MPELTRAKTKFEQAIERISFGNDHIAFFWRMSIAIPFLAYFSWVYALIFPFACVAIYEAAWRLWPQDPIPKAELATGGLWAAFLLAI